VVHTGGGFFGSKKKSDKVCGWPRGKLRDGFGAEGWRGKERVLMSKIKGEMNDFEMRRGVTAVKGVWV